MTTKDWTRTLTLARSVTKTPNAMILITTVPPSDALPLAAQRRNRTALQCSLACRLYEFSFSNPLLLLALSVKLPSHVDWVPPALPWRFLPSFSINLWHCAFDPFAMAGDSINSSQVGSLVGVGPTSMCLAGTFCGSVGLVA